MLLTEGAHRGRDLLRLAALSGVQASYLDGSRRRQTASAESLLAVLNALGVELRRPEEAPAVTAALLHSRWDWRCEPVAVAWDGKQAALPLYSPAGSAATVEASLLLEGGEESDWRADLDGLTVAGGLSVDGRAYLRRLLPLPRLPDGYHRLALRLRRAGQTLLEQEVLVMAAPSRFYERPGSSQRWGVFLPLYALRSSAGWGAGDLTDLRALGDWLSSRGGDVVATLPLLPLFLDQPFNASPYSPVSRLFWSEFYLDLRTPSLTAACAPARRLLEDGSTRALIDRLRGEHLVDYRGLMALKRRLLELLSACAFQGELRPELEAFLRQRPDVDEYARFRAAGERQGASWRRWPATEAGGLPAFDQAVYRYHAFAQWLAGEQMQQLGRETRAAGRDFYLDLPLGAHPDGYDAWRFQEQFVEDVDVGAPPDVLFQGGQDWGFAPLHPEKQRRSGYDYLRRVLRHHLSVASILRIDHVLGLHRLFWVPSGLPATQGVYVRYPAEELYAVLSLESHRHQATIVGENLGTAPREVGLALARHRLYETYVLQFELPAEPGARIRPPPAAAFASLNTHDMPPFAGYLKGRDIELRSETGYMDADEAAAELVVRRGQVDALKAELRRRGGLGRDESDLAVRDAAWRFLRRSKARYVCLNLEDAWLETETQNLPGTSSEYPNWRRKARLALEDLPSLSPDADGVADEEAGGKQ